MKNIKKLKYHSLSSLLTLTVAFSFGHTLTAAAIEVPAKIEAEDYNRFFDSTAGNTGGQYRNQDVDIQATSDSGGGYNIGWTSSGEWLEYDISTDNAAHYIADFRVASSPGGGMITAELNNQDIGKVLSINSTGGWQKWINLTFDLGQISKGNHRLRIKIQNGNFNLNWFDIREKGTTTVSCNGTPKLGDSGWILDEARNDSRYPQIREWAKAGVRGGIPCSSDLNIIETVSPGNNIQSAINRASQRGGGVVLLKSGIHNVNNVIEMKNNVVLRGENRRNSRLQVNMRNPWNGFGSKEWAISMNNIKNAGIENLTMFYSVPGHEPLDRNNFGEPFIDSHWPWNNDLKIRRGDREKKIITDRNLYVGFVKFSNTQDSWIQNSELLEAGTDPISVDNKSSYLTFRDNNIYRCYNKGGSGNCYIDIRGHHILMTGETVRKIRHVTLQLDAKYNVLFGNNFQVDVNFHSGDDGNNLLEENQSKLPFTHHWSNIATGSPAFGHRPPGQNNIFFHNSAEHERNGKLNIGDRNAVYTLTDYDKIEKIGPSPRRGTFYPLKRK